jgi:peptide/nickel transport system substrate-binding protein
VGRLEQNPTLAVAIVDPLGSQGQIRPNHLHPPFNHKKARQALLWMVNQETYLRAAIGEQRFWRPCGAFFMCGGPWETDIGADPVMRQDLQKAKQLMQESGYDGRPVVLLDNTDNPVNHTMALVTQQLLSKIGVKVDLQSMDWGHPRLAPGGEETTRRGWMEHVPDLVDLLGPVHPSGQSGGGRGV